MCLCNRKALTAGLVCCCLALGPWGATNAPAASIGHLLTAGSTVGFTGPAGPAGSSYAPNTQTGSGAGYAGYHGPAGYHAPNMVTGAALSSPVELARAAMYEPDRRWRIT